MRSAFYALRFTEYVKSKRIREASLYMTNLSQSNLIVYHISPPVGNDALNALFEAAWPAHAPGDFQPVLEHSLVYVCAYAGDRLIGFVNLAWDGGIHAFLLNTTVDRDWQRRGIGRALVRRAAAEARERGIHWLHVDYEPHLAVFYRNCGFRPTEAGLLWLTETPVEPESNGGS
jgi:GNAT superfamily N-acetyltransferase